MTSISELTVEHLSLVASWLARPEVNQWLSSEWRSREVNPSLVAQVLRNRRNRLFLVSHNSEPCGLVALSDLDTIDRFAMIWYFLGDDRFARKGITTEAVRLVSRIGFSEFGLASLYAWAMENNVASQRVLINAGFREAGRIRSAASFKQVQMDRVYFDMVAR